MFLLLEISRSELLPYGYFRAQYRVKISVRECFSKKKQTVNISKSLHVVDNDRKSKAFFKDCQEYQITIKSNIARFNRQM